MKELFKVEHDGILYRKMLEFNGRTPKEERVVVEISYCYPDNTNKNSLPNLWKKSGHTQKLYKNYISIQTYAEQPNGTCYAIYNPQNIIEDRRCVINFDWLFEISQDSENLLLHEVASMANKGINMKFKPSKQLSINL